MRTSKTSTCSIALNQVVIAAVFVSALNLLSASAHADDPEKVDVITVFAPAGKIVGRDAATGALIQERRVAVRVQFDPLTLATNSGVALLKDSIIEAAQKACGASISEDTVNCVYDASNFAQPEVDAVIARVRGSTAHSGRYARSPVQVSHLTAGGSTDSL